MTDSTLVATSPSGTTYTVTFRSDERYSTNWDLELEALALPRGGKAIAKTAGQSTIALDVSGGLLDNTGGDGTTDEQLWTILMPLVRETMGSKGSDGKLIKATLTLQLASGQSLVATGWVRNFIADREAPKGIAVIDITFNFLLEDDPTFNA